MDQERFRAEVNYNLEGVKSQAEMERERFRAGANLNLEQVKSQADLKKEQFRAGSEMEREQFRAGTSFQLESAKSQAAMEREQFNAMELWKRTELQMQREDAREVIKGENDLMLSYENHHNHLVEMQADLDHRLKLVGAELRVSATKTLLEEDTKRRASLVQQIEQRGALRSEVFKMLAGAIIQEKLAQRQHKRDMEMEAHKSELRRIEHYWDSIVAYLGALVGGNKIEVAKSEIDRLLSDWGAPS